MPNKCLDKSTIEDIKSKARKKLNEYSKLNDVIGNQIFNLLELESRVIYYPIEDNEVWGFYEKRVEGSFVWINTAIDYDKQVFTAAHELYHLWFENSGGLVLKKDLEVTKDSPHISEIELKANRFAAELLINEELLLQEMRTHNIDKNKIDIKDIFKLSDLFLVPYKTMVRRLSETKLLKENRQSELMKLSMEDVEMWRSRLGISLPTRQNKVGLSNLIDIAMELYESNMITREKLEYILKFAGLNTHDLGIKDEDH